MTTPRTLIGTSAVCAIYTELPIVPKITAFLAVARVPYAVTPIDENTFEIDVLPENEDLLIAANQHALTLDSLT